MHLNRCSNVKSRRIFQKKILWRIRINKKCVLLTACKKIIIIIILSIAYISHFELLLKKLNQNLSEYNEMAFFGAKHISTFVLSYFKLIRHSNAIKRLFEYYL